MVCMYVCMFVCVCANIPIKKLTFVWKFVLFVGSRQNSKFTFLFRQFFTKFCLWSVLEKNDQR